MVPGCHSSRALCCMSTGTLRSLLVLQACGFGTRVFKRLESQSREFGTAALGSGWPLEGLGRNGTWNLRHLCADDLFQASQQHFLSCCWLVLWNIFSADWYGTN